LYVLGASSTYALFRQGDTYPETLKTVPVSGGAAVTLPAPFGEDYDVGIAGSMVSAIGWDDSNNVPAVDFANANGTLLSSGDLPSGLHALAPSATGRYVWTRNVDKTVEVWNMVPGGGLLDLATLPGSAHHRIRQYGSDATGLVVAYQDSGCDKLAEDVVFVPAAGGSTTTLLHPTPTPPRDCKSQRAGRIVVGGGIAAWGWYAPSVGSSVKYVATSGGAVSSTTAFNGDDTYDGLGVSSSRLAAITDTSQLATMPIAGGGTTTSAFITSDSGLGSTGSGFVYAVVHTQSDSGLYTVNSASGTPTKIFTDSTDPFAASSVYDAPGQVGYEDNATPNHPAYTQSLARTSDIVVTNGPETTLSASTGLDDESLSLSGTRAAYTDSQGHLVLRSGNGAVATIAGNNTAPRFSGDAPANLSGRRVLYQAYDTPSGYAIYDDLTGTSTTVPGSSRLSDAQLWGDYLVTLGNGVVSRTDLATDTTTPIFTLPGYVAGDYTYGSVAAWGNTVAWSAYTCPHGGGNCTSTSSDYVTVAPGGIPGPPTFIPAWTFPGPQLSSGYVEYLSTDGGGTLIAQPLGGGSPTTVTTHPCHNATAFSVDDSTTAWLECPSPQSNETGTPMAAPLPHAANPPWLLGDPRAPTTYSAGAGTWDADFVTSAALTGCTVAITQAATQIKTLPCSANDMRLGEASVSWDGTNTAGLTVGAGTYTWTLNASNSDGGLRYYDGSDTPVTGSIQISAGVPGAPTGVAATSGSSQAAVSWTAPAATGGSPITGYDVQYSSNNGGTWTSASSTFHTTTATAQTVTGLANGTAYVFRVAAINAIGTGAYSAASAPVTVGVLPGTPTNVAATAGNAQATVSWTAPPVSGTPVVGYDVEYSSTGGTSWTSASATFHTSTTTTQTVTGLTNGTAYIFRVAAINGSGTGAYSAPSAAVTPGTTPSAPTNLTAVAGPGSATLTWSAPADPGSSAVTGYSVQKSTDGGTTWSASLQRVHAAKGSDSPATTKTVTGLVNGVSYVFRVAATNATGTGTYSTASAPVTPSGHEAQLTISGPSAIRAGKHAVLNAALTDTATLAPIGGATLELFARHGTSSWVSLGTVLADAGGDARSTVSPTHNTRYEWRFAGDATHGAAVSAVHVLTVRQVVTAHATDHHVTLGGTLDIYGTVSPREPGKSVTLQRRTHGVWVSAGTRATIVRRALPDGTHRYGYVISVTVHHAGTVHYRVHRSATSRNGAGSSRTITVRASR
jgi:hypothetical protein